MATILVVDDKAVSREFLAMLLSHARHRVVEATNGIEALARIHEHKPDLIITDLLMPSMNGYELAHQIKSNPDIADIVIIFYTASYLLNEAKLLAETCGVKYVLYKPSDAQLILDTVDEALRLAKNAEYKTTEPVTHLFSMLEEQLAALATQQDASRLGRLSQYLLEISKLNLEAMKERDPTRLLTIFAAGARRILNTKHCVIGIFHHEPNKLKHLVVANEEKTHINEVNITDVDYQFMKLIIDANQGSLIKSEEINLALSDRYPSFNSCLVAKLITPIQLYGFVFFTDPLNESTFNIDQIELANLLTTDLIILYENSDKFDEMQRHAARLQMTVNEYANKD